LILAAAIKGLAVGIVLAHNHPSGNLKPSVADEQLTAKIKTAASYHDIRLLDHIIVTADAYYSFADEGLL
jgi:DNA repair protein RadC